MTAPSFNVSIPEETVETLEIPEETADVIEIPGGTIYAPHDLNVSPTILRPTAERIATGRVIEIPEGCVGILTLDPYLAKMSKLRLAGDTILNPGDGEVVLYLDNNSRDCFWLAQGTAIAEVTIVRGKE